MAVDYENDGLGESTDMAVRVLGMEAFRILEASIRAAKERKDQAAREHSAMLADYQAQYDSRCELAARDLRPVMTDRFWKDADLEAVREKYVTARAFAEVDERFIPFAERIEEQGAELHGWTPEGIMDGPVPPGPRPMTDAQLREFVSKVPPPWYKVWASGRTAELDNIADDDERLAAHSQHAQTVRADMEHYRDTGALSENARRVQQEWEEGQHRTWRNRKVDPKEEFHKLGDEERAYYGWRPGGPIVQGPLDVDDARLLAATTAPQWYRLQELVAQDVPPAIRDRLESRLVEDMTRLRDTGHLDTPSAKEEWARFSGLPLSVEMQDPNESIAQFHVRRQESFDVHWAATEPARDLAAAPHGTHVGKPMSVAEAEEFAEQFAPDWLRDRHSALMEEAGKLDDPERVAYEQTNMREQFRYAMEEARDTGGLSHPYVASLRGNAAFMGVDESEGMRPVPEADRVRFGGPAARPMTHDEAMEVMRGWAPEWYRDQVNRTMRPGTELDDSARRITADAVRADMTELRDKGVLSSDHAQRLWAASQPGFDPTDPDSRKAMDRREQTWVETMGTRAGPEKMDPNNRERFGGRRADESMDTQPIPVITPEQRGPDDPAVVPEWLKAGGRGDDVFKDGEMSEDEWNRLPTDTRGPQDARDEAGWDTAAPDEDARNRWDVAPIPGAERAAERPRGPVYDSVDRRRRDAMVSLDSKIPPDTVDGMTVTDYAHPKRPGKESGGRPKDFEKWVEEAKQAKIDKGAGKGL